MEHGGLEMGSGSVCDWRGSRSLRTAASVMVYEGMERFVSQKKDFVVDARFNGELTKSNEGGGAAEFKIIEP